MRARAGTATRAVHGRAAGGSDRTNRSEIEHARRLQHVPATADHLVRLPPLRAAVQGQDLPTLAPELERTACLLEGRRSQHLLDQQLVRIANRNELHRATILAWPAGLETLASRPEQPSRR
jgi:hypothetical protein